MFWLGSVENSNKRTNNNNYLGVTRGESFVYIDIGIYREIVYAVYSYYVKQKKGETIFKLITITWVPGGGY
jgi:hypothetical protein